MLAKIAPASSDFYALARYLVAGKSGTPHPDRVAWTIGHNLPDADPDLAAKIMTATAELSPRTRKAAYHLMVAWHREEQPTPDVMQQIALKTLELAGLSEHQALIMGHGDRPHKHLHMLINRVAPTNGRAWKTSHDYARFDAIMAQLSDEFGFRYIPSHAYNPDLTDTLPTKPNSKATYAGKRGANTKRLKWAKRDARNFGQLLSDQLDPASSWDDVHVLLQDYGLVLEEKGRGLVVGNEAAYAKLSSLGLTQTAKGAFRRRAPKPSSTAPLRNEYSYQSSSALLPALLYWMRESEWRKRQLEFAERQTAFEELDWAHTFYRFGLVDSRQLRAADARAAATLDVDAQIERSKRSER